jgi:EAL domain-containing protein (putative c-di-GMP-specific phosphodiesterase class I)
VAQRIINILSEPFVIEGHEVFIGASIGITVYPMGGKNAETLLKNADVAMYHAKETGRNNYQFFTKSMNRLAFERLTLETRLHKALENNEFQLHYQPQLDINTGKIVGVEALIRWQQPEMGLVSPLDFIPLAEDTGLIVPIGDWVIRTACAQIGAWQRTGYPPVRMAVNLSSRQLKQKELIHVVGQALKETGVDPCWLELELTESSIMQSSEDPRAILDRLKSLGIQLSIDDFGTGYSSLSRLKRFPVDTLKVDRSFVKDIPSDAGNIAITQAMIAMAKGLKMKVIAEGVQTREQLQFLREQGCDWMQGYIFSPPVPADEMTRLLAEDTRL